MTIPSKMTAIGITEPGGPEVLQPIERPVPLPENHDILIRVHAAGVNRPDIFQRMGKYPPPRGTSDLPGLEVAGEVVEAPEGSGFETGDTVVALLAGGGYAQYVSVPMEQVLPKPEGLSMVEAAAIPETFFTVWTNLFMDGGLEKGQTALVHGGSSGIGTTAIMLAKAFGAKIYITAGSEEKCTACHKLGADLAINYKEKDFEEVVMHATQEKGVDVVLDMVGGDYLPKNLRLLARHGRHVSIATLHGAKTELDIRQIMMKRLVLTGSTLRPRSPAEKGEIAKALHKKVWPYLEAGRIKPVIHTTFALADAADAHRLMESSGHIGKIVLKVID